MLPDIWAWILRNKEWIFSGVGVAIFAVLGRHLFKRTASGTAFTNTAGAYSKNIQAGRDVHLTVQGRDEVTQDARKVFVDELVTFCSDSRALTTKVYLARQRDADTGTGNATMEAFAEVQRHDSASQRLQLRAKDTFSEKEVHHELFELLRRTSLSRQSLAIMETPYLAKGFTADLEWVDAQGRRTISAAARAAGYDLGKGDVPFLIGFHPSFKADSDESESSEQPPSNKIMYEYSLQKVKEQWEAAGHKWTPPETPEMFRPKKKDPDSERQFIPRRTSTPDICDGKVRYSLPFREEHQFWMDGYDSNPPLVLVDGIACCLRVDLITEMRQPLKAMKTFDKGRHPIDLISPLVTVRAREVVRSSTLARLQHSSQAVHDELRLGLDSVFEDYGYQLTAITVNVDAVGS